jgi:hypothetical protein
MFCPVSGERDEWSFPDKAISGVMVREGRPGFKGISVPPLRAGGRFTAGVIRRRKEAEIMRDGRRGIRRSIDPRIGTPRTHTRRRRNAILSL